MSLTKEAWAKLKSLKPKPPAFVWASVDIIEVPDKDIEGLVHKIASKGRTYNRGINKASYSKHQRRLLKRIRRTIKETQNVEA